VRRAIFTKSMKKYLILLLSVLVVFSCKTANKFRTYEMAEQEFRQSLTFHDTLSVLVLGQNFMDALKTGGIEYELQNLSVLDGNTLYKISNESLKELNARFGGLTISDYALSGYNFSTAGVNDLSYRYTLNGKVGSGPALKIVFNPVKVDDVWYLTLKDGNMASTDITPREQIHPLSPAPEKIVLNTKK